ncbi:MAG: DUF2341 domain-containing protein [Chitinispirillaceae bacterium]|nr:DUF2341 domain-containing protein [Chitinispirillaceae bacterium]
MKPFTTFPLLCYFLCACILPYLTVCTDNNLAGATTETTNGIVGSIYNSDNTPAPYTIVTLRTNDHNPVTDTSTNSTTTDTTNSHGEFTFRNINPGTYTILARDSTASKGTLIRNIAVNKDSLTTLHPVNLDKTGSVSTSFKKQSSITPESYIYIPGTDIYAFVEAEVDVILDEIPTGSLHEVILSRADGKKTNILQKEIIIQAEQTIFIDNPLWKYKRKITLNTSSSGASITSDLYSFPVLIRLNSTNFNFSQTQPGGTDLFVKGNNGKVLDAEIERWDTHTSQAEIWVNVDTIYGNNADQSITIYWGNPEVTSLTRNNIVFDSSYGFHTVWHLSESSDTVHDAGSHGFKGVRYGPVRQCPGIIGNGQIFTDTSAWFEMGNISNAGTNDLTLSAWLKRDTIGLQTIFAQSNGGKPSPTYGWSFSFDIVDNIHFFAATAGSSWSDNGAFGFWGKSELKITDTTAWHYVAVVIKRSGNEGCRVYIDGVDVTDNYEGSISGVGSISNQLPFRIGSESDSQYSFIGSIDECIISYEARSQSWIKLCFINQGADDKFLIFEPIQF